MYYFVCDIGGTKTRLARTQDLKEIDEPVIFETPDDPMEGLEMISKNILEMAGGEKIFGVCIGVAGVLDGERGELLRSFHLPKWVGIKVAKIVGEKTGAKVYLQNDTDIVGLGEAQFGAGQGFEKVVYISISTGIGGVKISGGKFENNVFGFEPGFQILDVERGLNFEDLASGTAIESKFGIPPKDVAKTEDWEKVVDVIAVGLHNSIIHWSPEVLVVGGSMSNDLKAEVLREKIGKLMKIHPALPEIRIARLGSIGGLYGGMAFLKMLQEERS